MWKLPLRLHYWPGVGFRFQYFNSSEIFYLLLSWLKLGDNIPVPICLSALCWLAWWVLWAKPIVLCPPQGCISCHSSLSHLTEFLSCILVNTQTQRDSRHGNVAHRSWKSSTGTAYNEIHLEEKAKGALTGRAKHFQELSFGTVPLPSPDGNSLSLSERHEGFVLSHNGISLQKYLPAFGTDWLLGQAYSVPSN